jgi:FixJ family two-component response regulator
VRTVSINYNQGATVALIKNSVISVVDDDESMRRMLTRGIEAAGFDVAVFNSAEEFLDSSSVSDSDCLVLDVDLPGMNGMELQQHLNESGTGISIIFMSGHADDLIKKRALEAGAAGFFSKPLSISTLVATLRTLQQQLNPI